jgi:DnaJ-domain-containing protein 1
MPENPFKAAILALIEACPAGLSEYDLIERLQRQDPAFAFAADEPKLALFRKHFLVMNALYELQAELFARGMSLSVSPLDIRLVPLPDAGAAALPTDNQAPLREYYLDWENFHRTGGRDVANMLGRFRRRYLAPEERHAALQALELPADASRERITQAYRRLAAQHHPDRGGDPARFRAIRGAYEFLLSRFLP